MAPELMWSRPLDGDELAVLVIDDRGELAVSTSRQRVEARAGGFDPMQSCWAHTAGGSEHHNLYAHRSYGLDVDGRVTWEHPSLRIARAIPEGWAALTDHHDLVLVDRAGQATRRQRLHGDLWRICGWHAGTPVVSSDPDATWVDPYVYSARDRQLRRADVAGRSLGAIDLARAPFEDECRRDPPPPGMPDTFLVPRQLRLIFDRERRSLIATHRLHMAWIASITLDGAISWVRLIEHACCNNACVAGDRIVHTSSCGNKVTVLADDGRVLASQHVPGTLDAVPDGRGGFCVRTLSAVQGVGENLEPTWSLSTDGIPQVAAHDGVLYVVTGRPDLVLTAYALT